RRRTGIRGSERAASSRAVHQLGGQTATDARGLGLQAIHAIVSASSTHDPPFPRRDGTPPRNDAPARPWSASFMVKLWLRHPISPVCRSTRAAGEPVGKIGVDRLHDGVAG